MRSLLFLICVLICPVLGLGQTESPEFDQALPWLYENGLSLYQEEQPPQIALSKILLIMKEYKKNPEKAKVFLKEYLIVEAFKKRGLDFDGLFSKKTKQVAKKSDEVFVLMIRGKNEWVVKEISVKKLLKLYRKEVRRLRKN